jgi:hypothetical protein
LGDATLILSPFEKPFLDELTDIPIKDHELPASELEVGPKENKVFAVAQKIVPPGMVEEAFTSLLGYCTSLTTSLLICRSTQSKSMGNPH